MDIRTMTLKKCYEIAGYKDLPLAEKNRIYDATKKEIEQKCSRYYSTLRPVSIGTYPKDGMIDFVNYDKRQEKPLPDGRKIMAWGEILYSRKLTEKECFSYDLIEI